MSIRPIKGKSSGNLWIGRGIEHRFKVVLGGSSAWQFIENEFRGEYGIDHIVLGNIGKRAPEVFRRIADGDSEELINLGSKSVEEIPVIRNPSINSLVEIMRGCGRGCSFCDPTMRRKLDIPLEQIKEEVEVNRRYFSHTILHSDDFLLYRCDNMDFYPNHDAIVDLFSQVKSIDGIERVAPTHCSLAAVVADEELIEKISEICRPKSDAWLGIQPGIETGSSELIKKHMSAKARPFSSEEWPEVVKNAVKIIGDNRSYVAATLIIGLPGEEDEDVEETISLVKDLSEKDYILASLLYVDYKTNRQLTITDLTVKQWELFYECWKHNCYQFQKWAWKATKGWNPLTRVITSFILTRIGSKRTMKMLEEIGRKKRAKIN